MSSAYRITMLGGEAFARVPLRSRSKELMATRDFNTFMANLVKWLVAKLAKSFGE
jgi:hypothetical protein